MSAGLGRWKAAHDWVLQLFVEPFLITQEEMILSKEFNSLRVPVNALPFRRDSLHQVKDALR